MSDAARYDWIRAHTRAGRTDGGFVFVLPDIEPLGNVMPGSVAQHLDAAIDAVRGEQPTCNLAAGATP